MKTQQQILFRLLACLAITVLFSTTGRAQLPPPPSGFVWALQTTTTYSDSGNFSQSLDVSQSLAPAGAPVISSLAETLSLTSFDTAGAVATLEADNPGMDYEIVVLSSNYNTSLNSSASSQIFNFDSAFSAHNYQGTTSSSNFQISGAGTAAPTTDSLVNSAFNVVAFGISNFADGTSSATATNISLTDSGTAPTDGSTLNFNYSGSSIQAMFSDDPTATNQLGIMTSTAFGDAELQTSYEVYKLVPIPEPTSTVFAMLAGLLVLRRRR